MRGMRRILIVDDHEPFRSAVRLLLEKGGFDVVGEAEDGEAALEAVRRLRPDIVLLDVQLPGADGFSTCERIVDLVRHGEGSAPVVVLTSGRPVGTFRRRLAASRAVGFIPKTDLTASGLSAMVGADP
jgi:DNA-binding NarL/FixJ family response regulator